MSERDKEKRLTQTPPERGVMVLESVVGIILVVVGFFLVFETGAYDISGFCEKGGLSGNARVEIFILFIIHLPWIAGAMLLKAAIRYFCKK